MQLPAADIDRVDAPRATLQQDFGEAAGRGADIEADAALQIESKLIEGGGELDAAARYVRMLGRGLDSRRSGNLLRRLCAPSRRRRVTRPAAIAAWARARLSNKPRATNSRSARCLVMFICAMAGLAVAP